MQTNKNIPFYLTTIGLFILLKFGYTLGASGGITKLVALISLAFSKSFVSESIYLTKQFQDGYLLNFLLILIIGLFFGSLSATKLSSASLKEKDKSLKIRYGGSTIKLHIFSFIGGAILIFGARLAGGCTSGHAITGGSQLSLTSFVFMIFVFASAIPTALFLKQLKK